MLAARTGECFDVTGPKLAIIGSREFIVPNAILYSRNVIQHYLDLFRPSLVVSGGATGIDSLAIDVAEHNKIPFIEYLPASKDWPGYRARNLQIAEECDIMVCIRCHMATSYGSGWTADRAKEMGKDVRQLWI